MLAKAFEKMDDSGRGERMSENLCVCCGASIPEGIQVCPRCQKGRDEYGARAIMKDGTDRFEHGSYQYITKWANEMVNQGEVHEVRFWRAY